MGERLRARDLAFLSAETPSAPRHNATVEIFDPGGSGFDHATLIRLIGDRIAFVPRYRQRVRRVPGHVANPVWADDPHFDLTYHVRRSALPRPGTMAQLRELVGRIVSRPLDRQRPLWEVYLVEGLESGRVAVLTKAHQALVDGAQIVDLAQVLLDRSPDPRDLGADEWHPEPATSPSGLLVDAVRDSLSSPITVVDTARGLADTWWRGTEDLTQGVVTWANALTGRRTVQDSPIGGPLSQQRRFATVRRSLADHRAVRDSHGGTVNDVVLSVVTGAIGNYLRARGQDTEGLEMRALVPVSVRAEEERGALGNRISAMMAPLPIWCEDPVQRLHLITETMGDLKGSGQAVGAEILTKIVDFAPTTIASQAARLQPAQRFFNLVVTNVPGPQFPLYVLGRQMESIFPLVPLARRQALCVGIMSYNGQVDFGLVGDYDAMADLDSFGLDLEGAIVELAGEASIAGSASQRSNRAETRNGSLSVK